jgi:hypothetical protein
MKGRLVIINLPFLLIEIFINLLNFLSLPAVQAGMKERYKENQSCLHIFLPMNRDLAKRGRQAGLRVFIF